MNTRNTHRATRVVTRLLALGLTVFLLAVAIFSLSTGSSHASVLRHRPPPSPTPSPTHTPSPTPSPSPPPGPWKLTGSMHNIRAGQTATLLPNGQVLVAGGYTDFYASVATASAELYNPATGTWATTGSMSIALIDATATLLPNGQVLVAGGYNQTAFVDSPVPLTSAELYNPATGTWTITGSMNFARVYHTATLLPNGQVLVAGGFSPGSLASAELYNPATGTWTITGSMNTARYSHTAALLSNGQVLVAGGCCTGGLQIASAELYNPATGTWTTTGSMSTGRADHTATLLPNGKVLVAGGNTTGAGVEVILASAELYNPATGAWTTTGSMSFRRNFQTATLLNNGQVLVAGGAGSPVTAGADNSPIASAELFNPATGAWTTTGSMTTPRLNQTATLLPNGQVLAAGGIDTGDIPIASAELFTP